MGSLNFEGGWASRNPQSERSHAGSRYFPPADGNFANKMTLEDAASQSFKEWDHKHPRADVLQRIDEQREGLSSYPIMQDKVMRSLLLMGGGYIILRNGFSFSPGVSMVVSGFAGYAFYEGSDWYILQNVYDKLKN